jgi:hypothetical protein
MVRLKFTAHPRTPIISPRFAPMASKDVAEVSMEHTNISAEWPEECLADDRTVVSTDVVSKRGARSDQENESEGSDDIERVKVGAALVFVSISLGFSPNSIRK